MTFDKGEIILFETDDGLTVDVQLQDETVWLSQAQMVELFDRERSVITKHINNVFSEGELEKEAVCAKFAHTADDGKQYQVNFYNLDVIISIGYRVKSRRGTQFRIWATSVLREHLIQGYTVNQKRLAERGITEAGQMLSLLQSTLNSHDLVSDEGRSVLEIVTNYARTWQLLWQYDEDSLQLTKQKATASKVLGLDEVRIAIESLKRELLTKGEATTIFGQELSTITINDGIKSKNVQDK